VANGTEDRGRDKRPKDRPDDSTGQLAVTGRNQNPFGIPGKVGTLLKRISFTLGSRDKRD